MRELLSRIDLIPNLVLEGRFDELDPDTLEDNGLRHWIAGHRFVIWNDRFVAVCNGSQWVEVFPSGGGVPTRYQTPIDALDHMLGKSKKDHLSDPRKMPVTRLKVAIPDHPEIVKQVPVQKLVAILRAGSSAFYAQQVIKELAKDDPVLWDRIEAVGHGLLT
jgi:hypothetical protein